MAAMFVYLKIETNNESFVDVIQNGGNDVTRKRRLPQPNSYEILGKLY